jgi:hypothetical protein
MLGAMYENGGNTTHRCLDGHPELWVYPFESQLGTKYVVDHLSSLFPFKYRWPVFPVDSSPESAYQAIVDEEGKVRTRTPHVSKFRHMPFEMEDEVRKEAFIARLPQPFSTGDAVAAFFQATFESWKDHRSSGQEKVYVGYSPIVTVDAQRILNSLPGAQILHVVRNPWSAYADTKKRPVPLPVDSYMLGWTVTQYRAIVAKRREPERVHIVRFEDLVEGPQKALAEVCAALGVGDSEALSEPSWNGEALEEVYPWGTIRAATPEQNHATAEELSPAEVETVRELAWRYLEEFQYTDFL